MTNESHRKTNSIPIWLVDHEVGGNLPTERTYSYSSLGSPYGFVLMPDGMRVERLADGVVLRDATDQSRILLVASLSVRRLVQAAVEGEFGLRWTTKAEADRSGEDSPR